MSFRVFICFDYGEKRIGLAVGQLLTATATPLGTVPVRNGKPEWRQITEMINQWHPDALVVGMPLHMDGSRQLLTECSERFSRQLEGRYGLPVYQADERLSTYEAKQRLERRYNVDAMAAQIILESWLAEQGAAAGR